MKTSLKYPTCAPLSLCFTLTVSAFSQDSVSVQFVTFPIRTAADPVELIVAESKTINVELPTNNLSKVYNTSRLTSWVLGKSTTNQEGKTIFQTYGMAPVLSGNKQVILVIRKGNTDSDGYTLIPFNADDSGFSGGKYMIFNASQVDIAGEIGDQTFRLSPLHHTLSAPKPSKEENGKKYLYTTLYFRKGNEAEPFYTSTWRFSEKARSMVFLYHEPYEKRLRLHTIRDYLP
jgi:hypothetical protein